MPLSRSRDASRVGLGGGYGGGEPPFVFFMPFHPATGEAKGKGFPAPRFSCTPDSPCGSFEARKCCVAGVYIV